MAHFRDTSLHLGLLILRLGAGSLLLFAHGWPKLAHFPERWTKFADPIGVGSGPSLALVVFAEVLCSLLVMLGLFTRLAVLPILGFFSIALLIQHAHDPWPKKEFVLIYAVPFLALLAAGAGRYSLDHRLAERREKRAAP
jgi:putative oxidoreductase